MKTQNNGRICANYLVLTLCLLLQLSACGGGAGSSSSGPPPAKDFTLSVSPTSISFTAGSSGAVSVEATAINGFSSNISVSVSGQQSGVSVSPQSFTLTPGTPQSVTFTAALNTPTSSVTVAIAGSSGSLQHTAQLGLTVMAPTAVRRFVRAMCGRMRRLGTLAGSINIGPSMTPTRFIFLLLTRSPIMFLCWMIPRNRRLRLSASPEHTGLMKRPMVA